MATPVLGGLTVGDLFRVTFRQRLFGQRVVNVLHYQCTEADAGVPDRFTAMVNLLSQITNPISLYTDMKELTCPELNYEEARCQYLKTPEDVFPYASLTLNETGVHVGACNLVNVAMSIEKRADPLPAFPRRGIGRLQLAGVPNDTYEEGQFLVTYVDEAFALTQSLTADITVPATGKFAPCLVHNTGAAYVPALIFAALAKVTVRDMRRRTVGVGE